MSFRKTSYADIIDARMGDDVRGMMKNAHRAVFTYDPRPGYLYVRSRAISSRCNDNFDYFGPEEIEKAYMTFIGKPVFVNHNNENHHRSRGVIIDAALHKDLNPDGSPDTWVELLHEIDAMSFPKLANAIVAKEVNRTSMGCDVQFSKCSACGNVATSPLEYCAHIPGKKGKRIVKLNPDGSKHEQLIFEICSGLSFFENSLLVEQPADPTAFFLGEVETGPGLESLKASVAKTASEDPMFYWKKNHRPFEFEDPKTWQKTASKTPTNNSNSIWGLLHQAAAEEVTVTASAIKPSVWKLINQAERIGDDIDNDLRENNPLYWNRLGSIQPPTLDWKYRVRVAKLNDDHPYETIAPSKNLKEMSKEEKAEHTAKLKDHATAWSARNPMHPQNIVDHWHAASPEEKENGENWYHDAHHTARIIAKGTNTPMHAMAGLISNYSPQTHWATNVINAAKVARTKAGIGGKGNKDGQPAISGPKAGVPRGIMASEGQKQVGHALVNAPHDEDEARASGQHYEQLLKGPKTQAFARLIHNGGDEHSVVVDRHAYSVASGARASDAAYGFSGLGGKKKYNEASDMYRQAAHTISQHEGRTIHPHQVQAATWLVRQRLNEAGDRELLKKGARSASAARSSIAEMHHYMGEHHPEASIQMPGTGYSKETGLVTGDSLDKKESIRHSAYGETKAPRDVDTLRAENCSVCGNSTAFDGVQCQICGYVAPPRPFGDPDVDSAKNNDVHKDVLDSDGDIADPNDPTQQLGNQLGNPDILDEQASDAETEGVIPALTCTNCGTGIQPSPPVSAGGEPPYPAEGDVCPVCKDGELAADGDDETSEDVDGDGVPDDEEQEGDSDPSSNPFTADDDSDDDEDEDEDEDAVPDKKKGDKK